MEIAYKCQCQTKETHVHVPDRRPNCELMVWMDIVRACVAFDHSSLSPYCRREKMSYLMIPLDESAGGIGEAPRIN